MPKKPSPYYLFSRLILQNVIQNARGGRIISILPNANLRKSEEERESSRPSSAEWIERKITVKQNNSRKIQNNPKIQNRLLASVKTNNKDSESEYSDTQSNGDDSPKPKRKPNLCWSVPAEPRCVKKDETVIFYRVFTCEYSFTRKKTVNFELCKLKSWVFVQ